MSGLSLGTRVSNLKSVALTILELLAFSAQKFRGSRDSGHAPSGKCLSGHVRTVLVIEMGRYIEIIAILSASYRIGVFRYIASYR